MFEVLSPSNTAREMQAKREFYERHGADEYYEFDPNPTPVELRGWERRGGSFVEIQPISGWVSPRLGIRFELGDDLTIYHPDGRPFETYRKVARRAKEERLRADEERQRRVEADRLADEERQRRVEADRLADEERSRADRLVAKLRELGIDPDE